MNFMLLVLWIMVCLVQAGFAAPQFLTISDIHYGSDNKLGEAQDTGNEFLEIALGKLRQLNKDIDFIIVLGDLPTHSLFVTQKKEDYEKAVFAGLYKADQGLKPMFYIAGNNDSLSGNYQPFEFKGKSPLDFATDWTGACVHCKGLLIDDKHMRSGGYYSSYVMPHNKDIILIALNTMQWTQSPVYAPQYPNQERDALEQFSWLEQQLKTHHAKQLLIAMHIPPGKTYKGSLLWHKDYLQKFITLLENHRHSYKQISLLTSHTHMDEIRKINLTGKAHIYAYSTPSISRNHHNNPGIKIFTLNNNMAIKNFTTYYTTSLNQWGNEHYSALGSSTAIFPMRSYKTLSKHLSSLSDEQICNSLEDGLFYGVKSDRVFKKVCNIIYRVN